MNGKVTRQEAKKSMRTISEYIANLESKCEGLEAENNLLKSALAINNPEFVGSVEAADYKAKFTEDIYMGLKQLGLSDEAIACKTGVSRSTVTRLKRRIKERNQES